MAAFAILIVLALLPLLFATFLVSFPIAFCLCKRGTFSITRLVAIGFACAFVVAFAFSLLDLFSSENMILSKRAIVVDGEVTVWGYRYSLFWGAVGSLAGVIGASLAGAALALIDRKR